MPSLFKAISKMCDRGLLATHECYCECCGPAAIVLAASRIAPERVLGFVHLGEWRALSTDTIRRVPLVFGVLKGGQKFDDPDAVRNVGEQVCRCLDDEKIPYEWNRAGGAITMLADQSVSDLPVDVIGEGLVIDDDSEDDTRQLVDATFDWVGVNPVRLLNVAELRRLRPEDPVLRGPIERPRVGRRVKLGFVVPDGVASPGREEMEESARRIQIESMWVEVTGIEGVYPDQRFRGELMDVPAFIDPALLRIGSPVTFTTAHVYPAVKASKTPVRQR